MVGPEYIPRYFLFQNEVSENYYLIQNYSSEKIEERQSHTFL